MRTIEWLERMSRGGLPLRDTSDQLRDYVYRLSDRAFQKGDADRDAVVTAAQLKERQEYVRRSFLHAVGTMPSVKTPLHAKTTGRLFFDGYHVEKIIYESRPCHYVTTNLYIPENLKAPSAAVLFLCGHHTEGKHVDTYQIACQYLVSAGLIVLSQDPVGQGERWSYFDPALKLEIIKSSCPEHDYTGFQNLALGESIAGYFAYDAMRGLDYLETRPEVDPARIGVTGNSGGATQASMLMLCDDRVAAAAPATFIMSRSAYLHTGQALQDCEQIWPGLTSQGVDHEDILLAMAPKPVLVLAVTDDFFPLESTEETVRRCRRFWELSKNGGNLELYVDDAKHNFTRKLANAAAVFFAKHLLGRDIERIDDQKVNPLPTKSLWCTRSGQVNGELPGARFVYDANQELLDEKLRLRGRRSAGERRRDADAFLREKVFTNRTPSPLCLKRTMTTKNVLELLCDSYLWNTQKDMVNHGLLFRAVEYHKECLPVTVALWEGGTSSLQAHYECLRKACHSGRAVLVLDVSGSGAVSQRSLMPDTAPGDFCGVLYKLTYDLLWLDDSLAALRVYDLLRCLDMLGQNSGVSLRDTEIYTYGRCSVYADLACFLDARIKTVESRRPLTSYADFIRSRYYDPRDIAGIILPGLVDYTDLDEIRTWNRTDAESIISENNREQGRTD